MKLCKGCFEKYDNTLTICPHCGYKEDTTPDSTLHMIPGTLLNERYIIGKVLGFGGFGVTYIAYDCILQMKTAVKEYLPSESATRTLGQAEITIFGGNKAEQFEDGKTKFIEEARKLAKFHSSEGIVKIFNTFECNNTAYIVMELLEGETLATMLNRETKIPPDQAIEMIKPIIMSLKDVHEKGIIHRDIAPDNIFITKDGRVKLIDFGAARNAMTSHSRSLTVMIKPGFSPEEQYRSRGDQGAHTDVYALAATLYKMITGVTPPDPLERRAYLENKGKDALKLPVKFTKDIDENVENAILNAMNVRIEDRTPDIDTFYKELTSGEPVKRRAGKISKINFYRWPLWAKIGFPTAAVLIVVFLIMLYAGLIVPKTGSVEFVVPDGQTFVPSIISKNLSEGEERLTESQLQLEIIDKVNDYEIPENYILTQSIHGGSIVPKNTVIQVTVSAKEKLIVPNLIGLNKDDALADLSERGFSVSEKKEYSSVIAKNCIVSQSLEADSEQSYGSEIELVVSMGKDPSSKEEVKEVTLPDFVGKSFDEVIKQAEKLGFSIKVSAKKYSKTYAKDAVMEQKPKSGKKIKTDKVVELVVSLGYQKITVPDVVYMTEEKAKTALTSRSLKVKVTYKNDNTVAEGNVISQDPAAESALDPESTVNLVVSKGSESFKMPDVVERSETDAISTLQSSGLVVNVTYKKDSSKNEGEVLAQSIMSGTDVKKGQSVTITVCTHSTVIIVPDVVGKTQNDAQKAIEDKGLAFTVSYVQSDSVETGRVISQTPTGSTGVKKGSAVTIEVSSGKDNTDETSSKTASSKSTSSKTVSSETTISETTSSETTYSGTTYSETTNSTTAPDVSDNSSQNAVTGNASSSSTTSKSVAKQGYGYSVSGLVLEVGETGTVLGGDAVENAVMTSNNTSVAVCNSDGTVTAVGVGTADITVKYNYSFPANATTPTFGPLNGYICKVTVLPTKRENTTLISYGDCGDNGNNVQWGLYDSGNLYIFGNGNMDNYDSSDEAPFHSYRYRVKNVIIESGVTSIGDMAFYDCDSLTAVDIPNSVTSIGYFAFSDCTSLNSINIPNSVTLIGNCAFESCRSLTTVNIPNSVTFIGMGAFSGCSSLTTVNIPNNVTSIGDYAFSNCSSLTTVNIPNSVTSIKYGAYKFCTCLYNIYFEGDKPELQLWNDVSVFDDVTATVYYPRNNPTWNDIESNWDGGGTMTFVPYDP